MVCRAEVVLDDDVVLEEEEQNSPSYPGLYTVYRYSVAKVLA